ncbi:MAG: DUF296 domain-containing protein [Candidatus Omnitrophica bacterium]|nr:DUF296 domain-containing protein [Candidatus Omnitrophota bacterium]
MKYSQGTTGRVFLVRFEHGDDLLSSLKELVRKEGIKLAHVNVLGALRKGEMVTGPSQLTLPALSDRRSFDDGREVVASGISIVEDSGEVKLHLHGSLGRGEGTLTGCLRKDVEVFITVDAVVTELLGIKVSKKKDPATGGHEVMFFE